MEKSKSFAKILIGVGTMLTAVPLGVIIVAMLSAQATTFDKAFALGWALWVTFGLLPLGLALLFVGLGYLVKLKRQSKLEAEAEDDED